MFSGVICVWEIVEERGVNYGFVLTDYHISDISLRQHVAFRAVLFVSEDTDE
jgi:hypothetical protein